jgi:hypothetical protein
MPTFSFTSSGVISSHGQGPAPSSASVPIVSLVSETTSSNKKKKQRTSKKQMKNNAPPSSLPTSTENPITLEEYPNGIDNHNHVTYTALKDEVDVETMNDDDLSSEPTFPDIVILKQTDKNYIVKHNHYPITNSENKKIDETSITIKNKNNNENNFTDNTVENSDLVSPNQIYKGQINKKRGRKPKAGMILSSNSSIYDTSEVPNIILHLKCSLNDLNEYNNKINKIIKNPLEYNPSIPPNVESYIQNDNLQFSSYNDSSLCSHGTNTNIDMNTNLNDSNHVFSKKFLAITIIMSKCKYIIFGSGNCSLWILFYRKNADNIMQYLNGKWYNSIV